MTSPTQKFEGKIALVTGATRGIGRAIALALAEQGAHIIAVGRTQGALEELDDAIEKTPGSASLVPADLKDMEGIDRLGGVIAERWGHLDILVGNAGQLGMIGPAAHIDPKSWADVMAVNVEANWRLIRSMDPLLRAAPAGRAVFITSGASRNLRPFFGLYSASKAALDAMVTCYAKEVEKLPLRVNLLNPGPTRTAMRQKLMPGEDPLSVTPAEDIAPLCLELCSPDCTRNGDWVDFSDWKLAQG
jgi:NAD(P)-dependent dehydrogenase (short-subunit alcohol dehydrogenase family)